MTGRILRYMSVFLLLALAAWGCHPYELHGMTEARGPATDLTFPDQDGQPFTLSNQKGKAVLMFFGYTNCPLECPTTLGSFRRVQEELEVDRDRVSFVMVTVDPERDTLEVLRRYMAQFDESFVALRGEGEALERVKQAYGAVGEKQHAQDGHGAPLVFHTTDIYLVGRTGDLETVFPYDTAPDIIAEDVRHLLGRR